MTKRGGLGRGLAALIPTSAPVPEIAPERSEEAPAVSLVPAPPAAAPASPPSRPAAPHRGKSTQI